MNKDEKNLEYWKNNCEEDYIKTPISVLRYISELEEAINYSQCCKSDSEQLIAFAEWKEYNGKWETHDQQVQNFLREYKRN